MAAAGACLVLGWFAFVRGTRVPLLSLADLGFHELGHLVTSFLPEVVNYGAGSFFQIAVPLGLATYFVLRRRDLAAGAVCLAWAATNAQDASVYIADAPFEQLELIGGDHDWATILGPDHFDALSSAHTLAAAVKGFGLVLLLLGLAICFAGPWLDARLNPLQPRRLQPTLETWGRVSRVGPPAGPRAGAGRS